MYYSSRRLLRFARNDKWFLQSIWDVIARSTQGRRSNLVVIVLFFILVIVPSVYGGISNIRAPQVAGSFYPKDPSELNQQIEAFLSKVPEQKSQENIFALIVPHAGTVYSGQVAAYGYKLIQNKTIDTVIVIGPSHRVSFIGASIWQDGAWETPLGSVEVDHDLAAAIADENRLLQNAPEIHIPEHSIEVEIPFLQKSLHGPFKIVPILIGDISLNTAEVLAKAIQKNLGKKKILIIISTDMSHYYSSDKAEKMDHEMLSIIEKMNSKEVFTEMESGKGELCGAGPVLTLFKLTEFLGNAKIKILNYAHSGNVTGDNSSVVGYGASVIYLDENKKENQNQLIPEAHAETGMNPPSGEILLNEEQQKTLLRVARLSVETKIQGTPPEDFQTTDPLLIQSRGVFVTLKKHNELRGCIGQILPVPDETLVMAVSGKAVAAATEDSRFTPVEKSELPELEYEVSVLSVPKLISSPDEIELGKHGVIVKNGSHSGVFLPQVATETGWSKQKFLDELCSQKAALPNNCWKDKNTEVYIFSAQVFHEK